MSNEPLTRQWERLCLPRASYRMRFWTLRDTMNNRPLSYVEEDIQLLILTPNLLQFGRPNILPETQSHQAKGSKVALAKGDVVIIKGEEKNRGLWKLGIVEELITGRDGVVRGAKLRAGRSYLERPVQHLYPMELSCDRTTAMPRATLSAEAPVFRPSRDAAVAARARIEDAAELTDDNY